MRDGFTELTTSTPGRSPACGRGRAPGRSCRGPARRVAPWISACASLPSAIFPSGITTPQQAPRGRRRRRPRRRCCPSRRRSPPWRRASTALRDRHGHAAVLERAGGVEPFDLQQHAAPRRRAAHARCVEQRRVALEQRDHRRGVGDRRCSRYSSISPRQPFAPRCPLSVLSQRPAGPRPTRCTSSHVLPARRPSRGGPTPGGVRDEDQGAPRRRRRAAASSGSTRGARRTWWRSPRAHRAGPRPRAPGSTATRCRRRPGWAGDERADGGALASLRHVLRRVDEVAEHRRRGGTAAGAAPVEHQLADRLSLDEHRVEGVAHRGQRVTFRHHRRVHVHRDLGRPTPSATVSSFTT